MKQATPNSSSLKKANRNGTLAIVASRFNADICEGLLNGAKSTLIEAGYGANNLDIFRVPGAFEIPITAKKCAETKKYQGLICLGAVIRGDTPHFEYISQAVTDGINRVALDSGLPVAFGVITTNTLDQALARSSADEYNKGREAALTVVEMVDLLRGI